MQGKCLGVPTTFLVLSSHLDTICLKRFLSYLKLFNLS
jgi:hypothetical protein